MEGDGERHAWECYDILEQENARLEGTLAGMRFRLAEFRLHSEERLWWMMLVHAEAVDRYVPKEDILLHMRVNGLIRCTLRDKFKMNLDPLGDHARDRYQDLVEEERAKEKAKDERDKKVDEILATLKKEYAHLFEKK